MTTAQWNKRTTRRFFYLFQRENYFCQYKTVCSTLEEHSSKVRNFEKLLESVCVF